MKVLFLDKVHACLQEILTQNDYTCIEASNFSLQEIKDILPQIEGLVVRSRIKMTQDFLKDAKKLKFIARSGAGMETIDEAYCQSKNITCFNAPEGNRNAVAEHALGMLLSLFNNLNLGNEQVRNGKWDREGNRGVEIEGKTIGIIGFGNNGSQFAKLLSGFDCEILAYDKYKSGFGTERVQEVPLEEIFKRANVVSFHIPQTKETIGWVNHEFFKQFKKPFYLINLSRGTIVDLKDLSEFIQEKRILGACLDVLPIENKDFEEKFKKNELSPEISNLLSSNKVIFTPHVGGWTHESYYKLSKVLANKIIEKFGSAD